MKNCIVGLAGNPNVGKTTVFNQLTGMHQHVGNWPGKTVERAEGHFDYSDVRFDVVDLPGNYALSAHSIEEIVSRDFIIDGDSDVIVNVVDAANLERNLYLTVQMMELGANLVMALNMNDFAQKKGHIIDIKAMSELLGFPVIEISAKDKTGFDELLSTVKKQASNPKDTSVKLAYGDELKEHVEEIRVLIEKDNSLNGVSSFWTAVKLLEHDEIVLEKVKNSSSGNKIMDKVNAVSKHLQDIYGEVPEEVIANARYAYIDGLIKETVQKPAVEKPTLTDKIDNIVTNRILGFPIFLVIMYILFHVVANVAPLFMDLIDAGLACLGDSI